MADSLSVQLSDTLSAVATKHLAGVEVVISGGHTDEGPLGWGYVIGDRLTGLGLTSRVVATNGTATVGVNSRSAYDTVCQVLRDFSQRGTP